MARILIFWQIILICLQFSNAQIDFSQCGKTKRCLFSPSNCDQTGQCDRYLSYSYTDGEDVIHFEITIKPPNPEEDFYTAVGFSYDNEMGNDSVTACAFVKNQPAQMYLGFNPGRHGSTQMIAENYANGIIQLISTSIENGLYKCKFAQKIRVPKSVSDAEPRIWSLDANNYYLLLASGNFNATTKSVKFHYEIPVITDSSVYLLSKSDSINFISKTGCGSTKGCMASPANCEPGFDCNRTVTWSMNGNDSIRFEISVRRPTEIMDFYAAVGVSVDGKMSNASVTACIFSGSTTGKAELSLWHNQGHQPQHVNSSSAQNLVHLEEAAFINDMLICRFTQKIYIEDIGLRSLIWPLNAPYKLLLARGNYDVSMGSLRKHTEIPMRSEDFVDLTGPLVQANTPITKTGCGQTKNCLDQDKCTGKWDACRVLTYALKDKDWIRFEISAKVPWGPQHYTEVSMYAAVGFSNDTRMPDTAFTLCTFSNSAGAGLRFGYIPPSEGFARPVIMDMPTEGYLRLIDAGFVDGSFVCRFEQKIDPRPDVPRGRMVSLRDDHYVFLLRGAWVDGMVRKHEENPITSVMPLNLTAAPKAEVSSTASALIPTATPSTAECGKTQGCVRIPSNCDPKTNCNFAVTYTIETDTSAYVTFDLAMQIPQSTVPYIAVGFSYDQLMGDDSVTLCYFDKTSNKGEVKLFWNPGPAQSRKRSIRVNAPENLKLIIPDTVTIANGIMSCKFKQIIHPPDTWKNVTFPLDSSEYYLLLARGTYNLAGDTLDGHFGTPTATAEKINITSFQVVSGAASDPYLLVKKAHGTLMIIGWWIFIINGILIARYFKSIMTKDIGSTKLWFVVHRTTNTLGLACVVIAFICIFVAKQGKWAGNDPESLGTHSILGMTAVVSGLFNPIMAFFRCHPGTEKRPIFNWVHRTIGILAWCTASAAIFEVSKDPFPFDLHENGRYKSAPRYLMYTYFIVLGLIVLILEELYASYEGKSGGKLFTKQTTPEPRSPAPQSPAVKGPTKFGYLRLMALLTFNIVAVSIAVIEVVIVALSIPTAM